MWLLLAGRICSSRRFSFSLAIRPLKIATFSWPGSSFIVDAYNNTNNSNNSAEFEHLRASVHIIRRRHLFNALHSSFVNLHTCSRDGKKSWYAVWMICPFVRQCESFLCLCGYIIPAVCQIPRADMKLHHHPPTTYANNSKALWCCCWSSATASQCKLNECREIQQVPYLSYYSPS